MNWIQSCDPRINLFDLRERECPICKQPMHLINFNTGYGGTRQECAPCQVIFQPTGLYWKGYRYSHFHSSILSKWNLSKDNIIHAPKELNSLAKILKIAEARGLNNWFYFLNDRAFPS